MNIAGRNVPLGAAIAALGGLLAIVASPLVWASAKLLGETDDINGFDKDFNSGLWAVIVGIIVLVVVAAWIMKVKIPSIGGFSGIALLVVLAGVLVLLVPVLTYQTSMINKTSLADDLKTIKDAGGDASLGLAFWLECLAGIVAIVGGALPLVRKAA